MKQLTILFLLFTLAGCETIEKLYDTFIGDGATCVQLESGAWVIYSPDGSTVECEK